MDLNAFVMKHWRMYSYLPEDSPIFASDSRREITEVGQVNFFMVGHNASHEFYLGTNGEKLFRGAVDCTEDESPSNPFTYEEVDPNNLGYMGHY